MLGEMVGSYRVTRLLGKGGMGVVYAATHKLLGREAAIKVLKPRYSRDEDMVGRFFNEARASSLIKHPGIVDAFDFGHLADGSAYIIMELLEGESLGQRLARESPLPFAKAVAITRQIAVILGAAHRKGIVHRDLKPDNVFLAVDPENPIGRVKILDFGIAKLLRTDGSSDPNGVTSEGQLLGTPAYMSPEQCRGAEAVDTRTDIYALGCMLYEMLCRRAPFHGAWGDILAAHLTEKPVPPHERNAVITEGLERLILDMLAKNRDDRPADMDAVIARLDSLERPVVTAVESSASTAPRSAGDARPRRRGWLLAVLAMLLAGAGAALVMMARRERPPVARVEPKETPRPTVTPLPRARILLTSQPSGAEVRLGGRLLGRTPVEHIADHGDGRAVYDLHLDGHVDARLEVALDRDQTVFAALEPTVAPPRPGRPPRIRPPAEAPPAPEPRKEDPINDGTVDPFAQ